MKAMKFLGYGALFLGGFGIDRLTKWFAVSNNVDVVVCPLLNFSLTWNRGVSWGVFHEASLLGFYVLTAFIALVIVGLAYYAFYHQLYKRQANICFETMVLAGAVSNLIDRFIFGGVVDFIQVHVGAWYFPTFNVADMFVVVGVFALFVKNMRCAHEI